MRKIYKLVAFQYNMLSKTELKFLNELGKGNDSISDLIGILKLSKSQAYRVLKSLERKNLISHKRSKVYLNNETYIALLLQLLSKSPAVIDILSDSGTEILGQTLEGKTAEEISRNTGLKKAIVYRKLKKGLTLSIIKKEKNRFFFNSKLWDNLKEFLIEFNKYSRIIDKRVSTGSIIYHKNKDEIIFESKKEQDASFTAFSAFPEYGINILLPEKYYYLPKKKLSKEQVFLHSLYICEIKKESRYFIYSAIFYLKFKKYLKRINNPILNIIQTILKKESVLGYPDFKEIKEKAVQYDIRME